MAHIDIISTIDNEIARLQEARKLLENVPDATAGIIVRRGRPAGSKNTPKAEEPRAKRVMSDETKQRMRDAQQKRHAANKRAAKKAAKEAAQAEATA